MLELTVGSSRATEENGSFATTASAGETVGGRCDGDNSVVETRRRVETD